MRNIILIAVLLLVTSCTSTQRQYALNTSMIAVESTELQLQYNNVEKIIREKRSVFTNNEWADLLMVDATIDALISRFDDMLAIDASKISMADVKMLWNMAAESYAKARSVIIAHWGEFQPSTQVLLGSFDRRANGISEKINELFTDPNNAKINQAMVLISGTLELAIKLITVGVAVL